MKCSATGCLVPVPLPVFPPVLCSAQVLPVWTSMSATFYYRSVGSSAPGRWTDWCLLLMQRKRECDGKHYRLDLREPICPVSCPLQPFTTHLSLFHTALHIPAQVKWAQMRVTHPASCESKGQISEHQSHTEGSPWGSLSSVGKQMEQTDKTGSNECAQSAGKQSDRREGSWPVLPWQPTAP